MWCSSRGTIVAPVGSDGGEGRTGTPFGGRLMGRTTGLAPAALGGWVGSPTVGGSGGADGAAGGDVVATATWLLSGPCGGALGGAAYSGWRRGWKNERIEDCWGRDMVRAWWDSSSCRWYHGRGTGETLVSLVKSWVQFTGSNEVQPTKSRLPLGIPVCATGKLKADRRQLRPLAFRSPTQPLFPSREFVF